MGCVRAMLSRAHRFMQGGVLPDGGMGNKERWTSSEPIARATRLVAYDFEMSEHAGPAVRRRSVARLDDLQRLADFPQHVLHRIQTACEFLSLARSLIFSVMVQRSQIIQNLIKPLDKKKLLTGQL